MPPSTASALRVLRPEDQTAPKVQLPPRERPKGGATRERILAIAEASVLAKGFDATSIEEIIAEAGLTKSGFFYHFRDKNELARAMMRRSAATDEVVYDQVFSRGRELSDDPLQAFLIGLKLLADVMADLPGGHPGCLIASICYQERLFDREVRDLARRGMEASNARLPRSGRGRLLRANRSPSRCCTVCRPASWKAASSWAMSEETAGAELKRGRSLGLQTACLAMGQGTLVPVRGSKGAGRWRPSAADPSDSGPA